MRIVNWNIEWARPTFNRGNLIDTIIKQKQPDLVCFTEAYEDHFKDGHTICSTEDYGYPIKPGRRKVLLWSDAPWTAIDAIGHPELPSGRFVSGITSGPTDQLRIVGVCIPWAAAHVSNGRGDRQRWEDHLVYLKHLRAMIRSYLDRDELPLIVIGDFNQRIPRSRSPENVYVALKTALGQLTIATENVRDEEGHLAIDHIAHSENLTASRLKTISKRQGQTIVSDHFGIECELAFDAAVSSSRNQDL